MRVISQDGTDDIPYENFTFSITVDNCIIASKNLAASPQELFCGRIAEYSSREKALKAMEMLRKTWLGESVEFENGFYRKNCVFQFPADDEV
jgi:hypothetical protein